MPLKPPIDRRVRERREPPDYTETQTDINALIMAERNDIQREKLIKDVNHMFDELRTQREKMVNIDILSERVEWLVYAVRGVIGALGVSIVGAVIAYLLTQKHG